MAARRAPSTRLKHARQKPMVLTREWEQHTKGNEEKMNETIAELPGVLTAEARASLSQSIQEVGEAINRNQAMFLYCWRRYNEDPRDFEHARHFASASLDELYDLTLILRNKGTMADAKTGRDMVRLCSEHGHAEATVQLVASALRQDNSNRGVLKTRAAMLGLGRLREFAQRGNVRALVLEANLARHAGLTAKAVQLYERALELIMEEDDTLPSQDKYARIQDEFSSPWIELAYLHVTQGQHIEALKAYLVGIEKDDPMAYFNLARLDYRMAGNQHTHDWLYNMTKAAASGHYSAAYELGQYYANSISDPAPPKMSFLDRIKDFGAFVYKSNLNLDPKSNIQHHDTFANTPELRIKLAYQWLSTARDNWYLPANISLALLHLQHFIYPSDTLSRALDPFGAEEHNPEAIKNPIFDPKRAMEALAEVMTACLIIPEAKSVSKTNVEYRIRAKPWSNHSEVLEVIEGANVLRELQQEAETIADAAGLDIRSSQSQRQDIPRIGLLYKHQGVQVTRGEGLYELHPEELSRYQEASRGQQGG